MRNLLLSVFAIIALSMALPSAFAATGYGTSSIAVSSNAVSLVPGNSTSINFTVQLAFGNTWGTTLKVVNQADLEAKGIQISVINESGDPPYSGSITFITSSATERGNYTAILQATGDDPSNSNTIVSLSIGSATGSAAQSGSTNSTTSTTATTTTTAPAANTTGASTSTTAKNSGASSSSTTSYPATSSTPISLVAIVVVMLLVTAYLLYAMKSTPTRLAILGIFLILAGTAIWLYGDLNGGIMSYIWGGVAAILLGTIVWIIGDYMAGAFRMKGK